MEPLISTFSSILPIMFSSIYCELNSLAVSKSHGVPMSFQKPLYSTVYTSFTIRASVNSISPLIDFLIFFKESNIFSLNKYIPALIDAFPFIPFSTIDNSFPFLVLTAPNFSPSSTFVINIAILPLFLARSFKFSSLINVSPFKQKNCPFTWFLARDTA